MLNKTKMSRKNKGEIINYWTSEMDDYITEYNNGDQSTRDRIYNDHLKVPLYRMSEIYYNLVYKKNNNNIEMINDGVTHVVNNALKSYNKSTGPSYSYCSVCLKWHYVYNFKRHIITENRHVHIPTYDTEGENNTNVLIDKISYNKYVSESLDTFTYERLDLFKKWISNPVNKCKIKKFLVHKKKDGHHARYRMINTIIDFLNGKEFKYLRTKPMARLMYDISPLFLQDIKDNKLEE